jgi:hypothetical protein
MDCGVDGHQQSARHEVDVPVELPWAQPGIRADRATAALRLLLALPLNFIVGRQEQAHQLGSTER